MLRVITTLDLTRALDLPLDYHLRDLLALRAAQLDVPEIEGVAAFTVIEPGDSVADVEAALDLAITGEDAFGFDWAIVHPSDWTEACIDWGNLAEVVLVPDRVDVDTDLLAACRAAAGQGHGADAQ